MGWLRKLWLFHIHEWDKWATGSAEVQYIWSKLSHGVAVQARVCKTCGEMQVERL